MQYNKQLKKLRVEKGFTEERLSKILHVDIDKIKAWEEGKQEPSVHELMQLSALYGVRVDEILENASQFIEIEQAIELGPDKTKRYVVGATGTNNDDIESLYYHDIDALKASIAAKKKEEQRKNPPTAKNDTIDKQNFWAKVIFMTAMIALFALLPILLTKNKFWAFFGIVPVFPCLIWAIVKKSKLFLKTIAFSCLFAGVLILIALLSIK